MHEDLHVDNNGKFVAVVPQDITRSNKKKKNNNSSKINVFDELNQ